MVYRVTIKVQSRNCAPTFHDVTEQTKAAVEESGIRNGIVSVYSRHTTCSVITQEPAFDMSMTGLETLQQDFMGIFENFIPVCRKEGMYLHPGLKAMAFAEEHGEDARGCHNTDAHLRSALVGRSESIPIIEGVLDTGDFGRIYFVDFDQTRARERVVQITVLGE